MNFHKIIVILGVLLVSVIWTTITTNKSATFKEKNKLPNSSVLEQTIDNVNIGAMSDIMDSLDKFDVSIVENNVPIVTATDCTKERIFTGYVLETSNIRREPNTESEVLKTVYIGNEIKLEQINEEWCKCVELEGYININCIDIHPVEIPVQTCEKTLEPSEFKRKGEVKYGSYRYTWYSQRVLPGGGLKIPGRHVDEDGFVCDENGYICLASGMHKKGTVLDTPVGRQGIVYDYCETDNTIDIYVNW